MNFGQKLKELRLQANMTQANLAEKLDVTKTVVSYYERNEKAPSPKTLIRIAAIFHVTSDYLLGIERSRMLDISGLDEDDEKMVKLLVENFRRKNKN